MIGKSPHIMSCPQMCRILGLLGSGADAHASKKTFVIPTLEVHHFTQAWISSCLKLHLRRWHHDHESSCPVRPCSMKPVQKKKKRLLLSKSFGGGT